MSAVICMFGTSTIFAANTDQQQQEDVKDR
jgi:hypothetical protein